MNTFFGIFIKKMENSAILIFINNYNNMCIVRLPQRLKSTFVQRGCAKIWHYLQIGGQKNREIDLFLYFTKLISRIFFLL